MESNKQSHSKIEKALTSASDLAGGGSQAAENLMSEVDSARNSHGSNSKAFQEFSTGVAAGLAEEGILPELSLGYARNHFQDLDMNENGQIDKVELYISTERVDNQVEKQLLGTLLNGFDQVREAHESNKFNPFAGDKVGITTDDLDTLLDHQDMERFKSSDNIESQKRYEFAIGAASDMMADNGKLFLKLARGERDGNRTTIEEDDLKDLLERDEKAGEYGSNVLNDRERQITTFLLKNWDTDSVKSMRSDVVDLVDPEGNEQRRVGEGDITLKSVEALLMQSIPVSKISVKPEISILPVEEPEVTHVEPKQTQSQKKSPAGEFASKPFQLEEAAERKSPESTGKVSKPKPVEVPAKPKPSAKEPAPEYKQQSVLTDEQLQANTRAYLKGEPMPFGQESKKHAAGPVKVNHERDIKIEQNIHVYPQEGFASRGQQEPTIVQVDRGGFYGNPYQNQSRWRPGYGGSYGHQNQWQNPGSGAYYPYAQSGSSEYSRSSDFGSGGNLSYGSEREYQRQSYGNGGGGSGPQGYYSGDAAPYSGVPERDGLDRALDFLNGVSSAAKPWLLWDSAKHSNGYGSYSGGYGGYGGNGRFQNVPRRRW